MTPALPAYLEMESGVRYGLQSAPAKRYTGFRSLHMQEGGLDNPLNMPAVRPPFLSGVSVKMTEAVQRMSYALMRHFNDSITPNKWTAVHGNATAFNNRTGCDIHRNYISNERMTAELPKYDKAGRHCAGAFLTGVTSYSVAQTITDAYQMVKGLVTTPKTFMPKFRNSFAALFADNILICYPGVDAIDANKPMPPLQTIIDNVWYFTAVTSSATQANHFPQGGGLPVMIPFILRDPAQFPLWWFAKWDAEELPDPLRFYAQ